MRISDWSSDVCSSDLTAKGSSPTRRRAHHTAWPSPSGSCWRTMVMSPGEGRVPSSAASDLPRRAIASSSSNRSEEHTSELQSLMRLSYAVFFLQKKINHIKTTGTSIQSHDYTLI